MPPAATPRGHNPQQITLTQAVVVAQWFELAFPWGPRVHHNAPWTSAVAAIHSPGRKSHVLQPTRQDALVGDDADVTHDAAATTIPARATRVGVYAVALDTHAKLHLGKFYRVVLLR